MEYHYEHSRPVQVNEQSHTQKNDIFKSSKITLNSSKKIYLKIC